MAKHHHDGPGPSQRQLRVGEVIRRTLAQVLGQAEVHDPELNAMSITVSEVQPSPDLRVAKVFVLPLGGQGRDEAIEALNRNKHELRRFVGKKTALKHTPDLRFIIDDSFDRLEESQRLFSQENVRRDLDQTDDE